MNACPYANRFELLKSRRDRMPEECGVIGAYDLAGHPVNDILYYGLYALQHRGQENAGIAMADGQAMRYHKGQGLVTDCFDQDERLDALGQGHLGIGHVRYSTAGDSNVVNAQPLVVHYKSGDLALAHNGNLVNAERWRTPVPSTRPRPIPRSWPTSSPAARTRTSWRPCSTPCATCAAPTPWSC